MLAARTSMEPLHSFAMAADDVTIYHDGSCPLCRLEIAHYRRQVGSQHLTFVDVAAAGADLGPDLSAVDAMARFHVRLPDGSLQSGAAGFATVWQHLPRWRWAGMIARQPGIRSLLEMAYRLFLPARPYLARAAERIGRP